MPNTERVVIRRLPRPALRGMGFAGIPPIEKTRVQRGGVGYDVSTIRQLIDDGAGFKEMFETVIFPLNVTERQIGPVDTQTEQEARSVHESAVVIIAALLGPCRNR